MRNFGCLLLAAAAIAAAADLPIAGLAHAGFLAGDLEKARRFYTGVLGYEEAFSMKLAEGSVSFFKVNDEQYIEVFDGLKPDQDVRMTHVALLTPAIDTLRRMLVERGLAPGEIAKTRGGNLTFEMKDPEGTRLEFLQYLPGSLHWRDRGKHLGRRRLSDHLWHAGIAVENAERAMAFYRDKLGFVETWRGGPAAGDIRWINLRMPGARGDYVELMLYSGKPTRQQLGSMLHICLEVPDIPASHRALLERGVPDEDRYQPRVGRNGKRLLNLFDPDGSRTELMEPRPAALQ